MFKPLDRLIPPSATPPMEQPTPSLLEQLDREQDELLEQLDRLNEQIEALIKQWSQTREPQAEAA